MENTGATQAAEPEPSTGATRYPLTVEMETRIQNNFIYHAPKGDQTNRYAFLRASARELAREIVVNTPPSREQSEALTCLENAVMWANAAIARNE